MQSICLKPQRERLFYFEVRSLNQENCYNKSSSMQSSMRTATTLADIEEDQKFDRALVKRLAKIVEVLQNIED